jgi:hypothetical protein
MCRPCRRRRHAANAAPEAVSRIVDCAHCHQTFTTTVPTKVYCSPQHKQAAKVARRPKPPKPPRLIPSTVPCVDCGAPIKRLPGSGRPPAYCEGCRVVRASLRAQQRRREENAALAALAAPGGRWARLLGRWSPTREDGSA